MNASQISCVPNVKQYLNHHCQPLSSKTNKNYPSWCESPIIGKKNFFLKIKNKYY